MIFLISLLAFTIVVTSFVLVLGYCYNKNVRIPRRRMLIIANWMLQYQPQKVEPVNPYTKTRFTRAEADAWERRSESAKDVPPHGGYPRPDDSPTLGATQRHRCDTAWKGGAHALTKTKTPDERLGSQAETMMPAA